MRIQVDPDRCQGHARCCGLAPTLFLVDDFGLASAAITEVPKALRARAQLAIANCPELAIRAIDE